MFLLHAFLFPCYESIAPSLVTYSILGNNSCSVENLTSKSRGVWFLLFSQIVLLNNNFSPVFLGEIDIHYTCPHFISLALILSSQAHSINLCLLTWRGILAHSDFLCFVSFIKIFVSTTLSSWFHLALCDGHILIPSLSLGTYSISPLYYLTQHIANHTQSCCCYPI